MQQPDESSKYRAAAGRLSTVTTGTATVKELDMQARLDLACKQVDAAAVFKMMPEFVLMDLGAWQATKAQIRKTFGKLIRDADINKVYNAEIKKIRRSRDGGDGHWTSRLLESEAGKVLPIVANVLTAFRGAPEWEGLLAYNESSLNTVARKAPPWEEVRPVPFVWTDDDDVRATEWLQHNNITVPNRITSEAVQAIADESKFHPIRDYISSLKWDEVPRIDTWLVDYLGVEKTNYALAVGAKWLIAAIARVLQPGCKCDCCLILEGPQGAFKSTALKTLGGEWHSDDMPELGTKDAALQTKGTWIIELAELDSMARSDVNRIKAFMSRATDRFRPPFGKRPIESPRESVFAGTVNHANYLKDETGGRRFWPVTCGEIKIEDLKRDRDQLWAEARDRYLGGATWWLQDKSIVTAANAEQRSRYEGDPWDEVIADFVDGREQVTMTQILENCIEKPKSQWNQADKTRVGRSLSSLGWRVSRPRAGEERDRIYRPAPVLPAQGVLVHREEYGTNESN